MQANSTCQISNMYLGLNRWNHLKNCFSDIARLLAVFFFNNRICFATHYRCKNVFRDQICNFSKSIIKDPSNLHKHQGLLGIAGKGTTEKRIWNICQMKDEAPFGLSKFLTHIHSIHNSG